MARVVQDRISSAKTQVNTVKNFIRGTSGPFETADAIVRQFRSANRRMLSAIGVSKLGTKITGSIRRRLRI